MILSYLEDLVKNNRQNIEGGDQHKRRAVRFHVWQRTTDAIFAASA